MWNSEEMVGGRNESDVNRTRPTRIMCPSLQHLKLCYRTRMMNISRCGLEKSKTEEKI